MTGARNHLRQRANQSHNLEHKPAKQKRAFSKDKPVAAAYLKAAKRLLGRS